MAYRRPESKAACDILVDSGCTFQNFRVVDVVAKAEVFADSGSVQEYYPEDGGRFLLRNVTCVNMFVSLLRWLDSLTTEARIRCQFSPSAISGGPSDTRRGFSPSTSVFPCQYHSTIAPYPFIHLPPTLYNVFLPVLQLSPVSIIVPLLHTHPFANTLALNEGQTGPTQNLSTSNALSQIIAAFHRKLFSCFHCLRIRSALRHRYTPLLQDVSLGVGMSNCLSFSLKTNVTINKPPSTHVQRKTETTRWWWLTFKGSCYYQVTSNVNNIFSGEPWHYLKLQQNFSSGSKRRSKDADIEKCASHYNCRQINESRSFEKKTMIQNSPGLHRIH